MMILLELVLFKRSQESLLKCNGIVEFSAALAETESSMFSADDLIRGILDEMNQHGGMKNILKMQSKHRVELERNDLQILHDELSSEISSLPESDLLLPNPSNTRKNSSSSTVSTSSSTTSQSTTRARYMSDSDFESLYDAFNRVAVERARKSKRHSITTKLRLNLEMQCQDYRNLSFQEFCKLMESLGVIYEDSTSKQKGGAEAAASKLLRNIVKSLTEKSAKSMKKTSKLSVLRALFNFFDHDNDGKINSKEFLSGMVMLDPTNRGHVDEKLELFFKLFDVDGNGTLEPDEVSRLHKWLRRVNGMVDMHTSIESPHVMKIDEKVTDTPMNVKEFIASVRELEHVMSHVLKLYSPPLFLCFFFERTQTRISIEYVGTQRTHALRNDATSNRSI